MPDAADFRPAWWLPGAHLQTVWGRLARPRLAVSLRRELLPTPDGDELIIDHLDGDPGLRFVLLHGLEGSSHSVYMQGLLLEIAKRGWSATVLNFRSCAREQLNWRVMIPNRTYRLYHSGETEDLDYLLGILKSREPSSQMVAFGASLGGNVLLKWLGEHPTQSFLHAASTISVPYDLGAGARHLESRLGGLYVSSFLRSLKRKSLDKVARFPLAAERIDARRVMESNSFYTFDDAATAPLHGFAGAEDYYTRSSSVSFVEHIRIPTLCLSSHDDPFLPRKVLETIAARVPPNVQLRLTSLGGHVGFVSGSAPWRCRYWAEELIVEWLAARVDVRKPG
ncbi:MAG TPA: alpha/beta fold hydrolase [Thermoanaerobaculia bacterium]|nr:alpha/beta fold hydrolase [Thermoanaerobaculia bacterium]